MNSAIAVEYCSRSIRQLMKNTSPSVASSSTMTAGPPKIVCPNEVSETIRPAGIGVHRRLEGEPGHDAGQRHGASHVVVDADHVGAQPRVDGNCPIGAEAAAGR